MLHRFLILILLLLSPIAAFSQQNSPIYSRVRILFGEKQNVDLARLGIECDHGDYQHNRSLTTDLSADEIQTAREADFDVEVLIPDVSEWYANQQAANLLEDRSENCNNAPVFAKYSTPDNYTIGSMGGYPTLSEMIATLDLMRDKFPNLITARINASDTITTHEGRPLWYVKISDNPNTDESEPRVLYTALHHAREPNGMSQMLFYI